MGADYAWRFQRVFYGIAILLATGTISGPWQEAIQRLRDGHKKSALVTSMAVPSNSFFLSWWPMYADGDRVHFQEQMLLFDQLETPFDEGNIYQSIDERKTHSEDGGTISEWTVGLANVLEGL